MFSSLVIQAGDREAPQLQLAQLGWRDIALGSKTWQIPLASPTWTPQSRGTSVEKGFCRKPKQSACSASVGCSLRGAQPNSSSAELFILVLSLPLGNKIHFLARSGHVC